MAVTKAATFVMLGAGLATLTVQSRRLEPLGEALLAGGIFVPLAVLIGYVYNVIPVRGLGQGLQMAIHTAVGCLALGVGGYAARPDWTLTRMFREPSPGAIAARRLLPLIVLVPVVLGVVRLLAEHAGLLDLADGSAAATVADMFLLALVVRFTSRNIDDAHLERLVSERGRSAADLERVFAAFTQLDGRLTRTSEGTGLGLSISREMARGMRGDVTVTSVPEHGSTFTLTLPRYDRGSISPET